ncbi:hypothetical protein BASA83_008220 [Batrachochytrium salamandrivorans]|nr:hypothetical protein BASA83_008220 [Batrachochytrium salamandrivorans]
MTLAIKIDNRIQERRREQTQSARPLSQRSSNYVPCPRRAPYQPRWHAMSTLTDLRALPNVLGPLTNKPLFFSFISFDISVTTLLSQYRIARRDNTGRFRQFQQANELQQEVNSLRTELDFLIQTQRSLTQQPTLQVSPSPPVVSQNYTPPRC